MGIAGAARSLNGYVREEEEGKRKKRRRMRSWLVTRRGQVAPNGGRDQFATVLRKMAVCGGRVSYPTHMVHIIDFAPSETLCMQPHETCTRW